ncbi:ABC transporter type 1, transmembrane domain-containing protein, partial [Blastocladiella britannica]
MFGNKKSDTHIPIDGEEEIAPTPAAPTANKVPISQLFRFAGPRERAVMVVGALASIANGAMMPLWGLLMGDSVNAFVRHDIFVAKRDAHPAAFTPAIMDSLNSAFMDDVMDTVYKFLALAAASFTVAFVQMALWQWVGKEQAERLKQAYFKALLTQEVAFFDDQKRGELTSRITADIERFQAGVGDKVGLTIFNVSTFVVGYGIGFGKNLELMSILLCALPLFVAAFATQGLLTVKVSQTTIKSATNAGAVAEELFSAIRTVASFGGERRETKRFHKISEEICTSDSKLGNIMGTGFAAVFGVMYLSYALLLWYGSRMLADGKIPVGTIVTLFSCYFYGSLALGQSAPYIGEFVQAQIAAYEIFK